MWIKNCWYVIAWEHEVPSAESADIFQRKVLNEPIVVYRTQAGKLVALEDRCCHRHAPLSAGRREGDSIRCGYHGLKFNEQGRCIEIPGADKVPPKACVRSYPVVSKNNWVFVWMGDPDKANETLLPDNFSCNDPAWKNIPGYLHYDTPYLLICDNLLDFSHLSYVHEKTLWFNSHCTGQTKHRKSQSARSARNTSCSPYPRRTVTTFLSALQDLHDPS